METVCIAYVMPFKHGRGKCDFLQQAPSVIGVCVRPNCEFGLHSYSEFDLGVARLYRGEQSEKVGNEKKSAKSDLNRIDSWKSKSESHPVQTSRSLWAARGPWLASQATFWPFP